MKTEVVITRIARKGLEAAPTHVRNKFLDWVSSVRRFGLAEVRRVPAFHDEPLQGKRKEQRSIRLNRQWRAIYTETAEQTILVTILEVTTHDYRTR